MYRYCRTWSWWYRFSASEANTWCKSEEEIGLAPWGKQDENRGNLIMGERKKGRSTILWGKYFKKRIMTKRNNLININNSFSCNSYINSFCHILSNKPKRYLVSILLQRNPVACTESKTGGALTIFTCGARKVFFAPHQIFRFRWGALIIVGGALAKNRLSGISSALKMFCNVYQNELCALLFWLHNNYSAKKVIDI